MKKALLKIWAKKISKDVWTRLIFTYSRDGIRTNEVTITDNILYEFFKLASKFSLPVKLFEAKDEKIEGNDMELVIETSSGYVLLPCQACV